MKLQFKNNLGLNQQPTLKSPHTPFIPSLKIPNKSSMYVPIPQPPIPCHTSLLFHESSQSLLNYCRYTLRNPHNRHRIHSNLHKQHHQEQQQQTTTEPEWIREQLPLTISSTTWQSIPHKYKLIIATSLSFIICNLDKVNISVAIIPMAEDFGWSPTISGLVQSSFFYGYLLSQIPGGYASTQYGGKKILPLGVTLWSLATASVPILAGTIPGLCLSRAAVGLGEGVAPSAATDIVARAVDPKERSRAISFIFGGLHVGSLMGLLIAPSLIEWLGWPSVFYLFGGMGVVWSVWWNRLIVSAGEGEEVEKEKGSGDVVTGSSSDGGVVLVSNSSNNNNNANSNTIDDGKVPWRAFLRNRAVQALAFTHFCNNWFHYTMLAWLPTYFTDTLSLNLVKAAQVSVLPPIAAIAVSAIVGPLADNAIEQGIDTGTVRKLAQSAAFLGPALGLIAASLTSDDNGILTVACITLSLGLASFSLGGLYCNHADLSPRYAPVLLGLTNTAGAIPGIMGVAFTGWVYDITGSWTDALFIPSIFFFLSGTVVFLMNGTSERQDFHGSGMNEPFGVERLLPWYNNINNDDDSSITSD